MFTKRKLPKSFLCCYLNVNILARAMKSVASKGHWPVNYVFNASMSFGLIMPSPSLSNKLKQSFSCSRLPFAIIYDFIAARYAVKFRESTLRQFKEETILSAIIFEYFYGIKGLKLIFNNVGTYFPKML